MDAIDKRILNLLQKDGKLNTKEIADQVGLTISPTFERIRKLENTAIRKYVALLDKKALDLNIHVFCNVTLSKHSRASIDEFKKQACALNEVMECYHISGNADFMLKILVKDMNAYQKFIVDKLSIIPGLSNVQSSFVMEEIKHETAIILR